MLFACELIPIHPVGAAHQYQLDVFVSTYPVVAVPLGVNPASNAIVSAEL